MRFKKVLLGALVTAVSVIIPSLAYGQAYGTAATQTLNVREGARTDARILEQISIGSPVEIIAEQGDWLKIVLQDDSRAYVKSEFITVHRVMAKVQVSSGLNVRDYPSTTKGKIIGKFYEGDEISVHFAVGDWYKISQDGFEGYVHKDYIKTDYSKYLLTKQLSEIERITKTQAENAGVATQNNTIKVVNVAATEGVSKPATQPASSTGEAIVAYAKQFLGNPYVYGGNSLSNGVDCSGFTSQIMKNFGISLQRSSGSQYANNGYSVSSDNLQKGDLLFYGYGGNVSHVAIYIGGGQVVHANDERTGICISNAFPSNGKPFIGAKRVI